MSDGLLGDKARMRNKTVASELPEKPSPDDVPERQLESWKEIARYVHRDVSTVQRWEKREGMPVHRHLHDSRGSVYAFPSELDGWLESRRSPGESPTGAPPPLPVEVKGSGHLWLGSRRSRVLLVGAAALVAALGIAYVKTREPAASTSEPKIRSLAVMPFENLSGDASQDYLADGMTEAIIGRLSAIRDLRVISRTSVMALKNTRLSAREVAEKLHVDALVEGSVIRGEGRVRIQARLIRGVTDDHVWVEVYDREEGDTVALESEVAQAVAQKIEVTLTDEERARLLEARPVSPEVYEAYLEGRFGRGDSRAAVEEKIRHFEDAIAKDAGFAPAYLGLAAAYSELGTVFVGAPLGGLHSKVMSLARKTLELDPYSSEAHVLLGTVYRLELRWADAEAEYRRALQLNPNDSAAHFELAKWLVRQGRTEEAIARCRRARELDPLGIEGADIAFILFLARRFDDAERELRSALALRPDDAAALWYLGFVLTATDRPDEAVAVLERALEISGGSPGVMGVLVRAYARSGRRADALRLLAELTRRQETSYVPAAAFVNAYLGLGEDAQALEWLERAYREQSPIVQNMKVHPFFDPLRGDPRFMDLLRRAGLD